MTSYLQIPRCPGPPLNVALSPKTRPARLCRTAEEPEVPQGPGQQLGSHRDEEEEGRRESSPATTQPSSPPHPTPRRHTLFLFSFGVSVIGASSKLTGLVLLKS